MHRSQITIEKIKRLDPHAYAQDDNAIHNAQITIEKTIEELKIKDKILTLTLRMTMQFIMHKPQLRRQLKN